MSAPGTPQTPRGPVQGEILIDPKTGYPINTVGGKLDVNASVTATIGEIEIDAATSSVRVEDPDTGAHVKVETDGSINVNTKIEASQGDSALVAGTEDGTLTGTQHIAKIGSDGKLEVKDTAADASLASIDSKLNTLGQKNMAGSMPVAIATDQSPIPVTGSFVVPPGTIPDVFTEIDLAYDVNQNLSVVTYDVPVGPPVVLTLSYDTNGNLTKVVPS